MKWIKENWLLLFLAIIIFIAGVSTWKFVVFIQNEFGSFFPLTSIFFDEDRSEWGAVGDLFGGILNPFFAFLGLVMLLVTLFQNQKELSLSRKELKHSAESLAEQAKTQKTQQFENTFFSLLDQHNISLNYIESERINYDSDGNASTSKSIASIFRERYFERSSLFDEDDKLKEVKASLLKSNVRINQYFRVLYQVLKFIATNCPETTMDKDFSVEFFKNTSCSKNEKLYSNIVRSLMSDDVLLLLCINCHCRGEEDDFYKYKLLIERYAFFEHAPVMKYVNTQTPLINEIISSYEKSAFGNNECVGLIEKE